MWTWQQPDGGLLDPDGSHRAFGYSGRGDGLNAPLSQSVHDVGPIPQGLWIIGEFFDDPGGKGPVVCHLTPAATTETFGRSGFMIHGDNSAANHTASEGCIILARVFREAIRDSGDTILNVVA